MVASDIKPKEGLRLRLMGVPEVSLNGVPLTFSRRRALALLVYLAVTGHVHTRDVLATLLSGEAADSQARKRLSNALAELRQLVGDYVVTTRDTASFNTNLPSWMDVRAFRQALASGMEDEGLEGLEAALDLYHEEFLSGLTVSEASGFDEWVMLQGETLRTQAVQALQAIVARAMRMKANAKGVAAARRLVSLEPLLEDARRQLMTLLARVGQRQEALAQYEICRSLLEDELGEEPSPELVALYHRLKMAHITPPHGLPVCEGLCVGRDAELGVLAARLAEPECRLITLVGLGGSGKTRLALEVAHMLADAPSPAEQPFPDGVFFVPLDGRSPSSANGDKALNEVLRHVVEVLSPAIANGAPTPIDAPGQLQAALKSKALLLVLDGVDQVPSKEATAVIELLLSCPQATLLITSREALQLPGEYVLAVGDLELPTGSDDVERASASQMLLVEAERNRLGFVLRDEDRPHVVRLCHLVGGLPLALMLLAQWLPKLTPEDLVEELERNLDLLVTTDPRIRERQRNICAILAQSWEHLSEDEQRITRQLSVFHDGFDSAAAREVAACSMQHITRLIDVGIVTQPQRTRYRLHELVRRYAYQQLRARLREAAGTQQRHAQYYARLAQSLTDGTRPQGEAREAIRGEMDNVQGAWDWALAQRSWETLGQLSEVYSGYFHSTGLFGEGVAVVAEAVEALQPVVIAAGRPAPELQMLLVNLLCQEASLLVKMAQYGRAEQVLADAAMRAQSIECLPLQARLNYLQGVDSAYQGRYSTGKEHIDKALALAQTAGMPDLEVDCLLVLSQLIYALGDTGQALGLMQQVVAGYREMDNPQGEIRALTDLGRMAIEQGDHEWGRLSLERAQRLLDESGREPMVESALLSAFGLLNIAAGRYTEAEEYYTRALQINRQVGWREAAAVSPILGECGSLTYLGRSARIQGDVTAAHECLSQALSVCQGIDSPFGEAMVLIEMSLLHHVESDDRRSRQLAKQALSIIDRSKQCPFRRSALVALGHAEYGLGHLSEAATAYSQALTLDRERGNRWQVIESTADLARVALAEGDKLRASALLESILYDLLPGNPSTIDEPARAYLTAYEILHSIGDARDSVLLDTGCRLLQERTAGIPDEMRRLLFLQHVGPNRDLLHARNGNGFHRETISRVSVYGDS
jgi:DNA-binding SARP family transcriptional activator/predicted ATPase